MSDTVTGAAVGAATGAEQQEASRLRETDLWSTSFSTSVLWAGGMQGKKGKPRACREEHQWRHGPQGCGGLRSMCRDQLKLGVHPEVPRLTADSWVKMGTLSDGGGGVRSVSGLEVSKHN